MPPLNLVSGKALRKILEGSGFNVIRSRGSHYFLAHDDGRVTTIPIHGNSILPPGMIKAILGDIRMTVEEYEKLRLR